MKCDYCGKESDELIPGWDMEEEKDKNACRKCDYILSL